MSIGFILFLYNLFLCDIDSIYTMFFFNITCNFIWTTSLQQTFKQKNNNPAVFEIIACIDHRHLFEFSLTYVVNL